MCRRQLFREKFSSTTSKPSTKRVLTQSASPRCNNMCDNCAGDHMKVDVRAKPPKPLSAAGRKNSSSGSDKASLVSARDMLLQEDIEEAEWIDAAPRAGTKRKMGAPTLYDVDEDDDDGWTAPVSSSSSLKEAQKPLGAPKSSLFAGSLPVGKTTASVNKIDELHADPPNTAKSRTTFTKASQLRATSIPADQQSGNGSGSGSLLQKASSYASSGVGSHRSTVPITGRNPAPIKRLGGKGTGSMLPGRSTGVGASKEQANGVGIIDLLDD